jgi:hypothetical protein
MNISVQLTDLLMALHHAPLAAHDVRNFLDQRNITRALRKGLIHSNKRTYFLSHDGAQRLASARGVQGKPEVGAKPACYSMPSEFDAWVSLSKLSGERVSICDDYPTDFEHGMKKAGRCDRAHWQIILFGRTRDAAK